MATFWLRVLLACMAVAIAIRGFFSHSRVFKGFHNVVEPNRTYFFWTHHKTGTNLMQAICNLTAKTLTGGEDQCAWCLRINEVDKDGKYVCAPDTHPEHGPLRASVGRFTLLSSIGPTEYGLIHRHTPNFRAIHMIREPVKMAISAYQYNKYVTTSAGAKWRWDMSAEELSKNRSDLSEELKLEAQAILSPIWEMSVVHQYASTDPRIMALDLETFEGGFEDTTTRLFRFLFDKLTAQGMATLVRNANYADKSRWSKRQLQQATTAPSQSMNSTEIRLAWQALEDAGDEDVLKVKGFREGLGYASTPTPKTKKAHEEV